RVRRWRIGVRAVGTVAADRNIDELGAVACQLSVAHAQPRCHTRPEILDQYVGLAGQPGEQSSARWLPCVYAQAALADVVGDGQGAVCAAHYAHVAAPVAGGRFDFYDLGALLPQELRTVRPGNALADVQHAQAREGQRHRGGDGTMHETYVIWWVYPLMVGRHTVFDNAWNCASNGESCLTIFPT